MRNRTMTLAAILGLGLALALPAYGALTVRFVDPQGYTDAGSYGVDAERNLRTLERYLVRLGERCIAPSESLELSVLNVDLAGREEWWHPGAYDLRVMRDITWPRIELEFVWRDADGAMLGEGRERVADMAYLSRSAWVRNDPDRLPYERAMLHDWFGRRFCATSDRPAS